MSKEAYIPDKGDIIWLIFDPRVGHEQSGRRPALVVSEKLLTERTGLALVCPITSKVKGLPFEIVLRRTSTQGAVLPIHLRSVDIQVRKAAYIERAPKEVQQAVSMAVQALLGEEN